MDSAIYHQLERSVTAAVTAGTSPLPHLRLSDQAINSHTKAKARRAPGRPDTAIALLYIPTDPPLKRPAVGGGRGQRSAAQP